MRKAIGIAACCSVAAATVWLAWWGWRTRTAAAGLDEFDRSGDNYAANARYAGSPRQNFGEMARQYMDEARKLLREGDAAGARSMARAAARMRVTWTAGEETPQKFLTRIPADADRPVAARTEPTVIAPSRGAARTDYYRPAGGDQRVADGADRLYETGRRNKAEVLRLMAEARRDMQAGNFKSARSRLAAAAKIPAEFTEYEEQPKHLLAEIARLEREPAAPRRTVRAQSPDFSTEVQPQDAKAHAIQLLKAARRDISEGRFQQARAKALEAQKLNVAWSPFDEHPKHVLADVNRRTGSTTVTPADHAAAPWAKSGVQPAGKTTALKPAAAPDQSRHDEAAALLKQARRHLDQGEIETAVSLAKQVEQMGLKFRSFEDQPALVLDDAKRIRADRAKLAASQQTMQRASNSPKKLQAVELVRQARADLTAGRIRAAKQKAEQARSLEAVYSLYEERPEHLLAQIERMTGQPGSVNHIAKGSPKASSPDLPKAEQLMKQARTAMQSGNLNDARDLALKAGKLDVAWQLFEETPQKLLADINAADATRNIAKSGAGNVEPAGATATADKARVQALMRAAQADIDAGNLDAAIDKAREASKYDVTYGPFDTRPTRIFEKVAQLQNAGPKKFIQGSDFMPVAQAERGNPFGRKDGAQPAVLHPAGVSAVEHFRRGEEQMRNGDNASAYEAFVKAYDDAGQLSPRQRQQLDDYLRHLTPRKRIQLTAGENKLKQPSGPNLLDLANRQQRVRFERLRNETLNAVYRAERWREKNPERALEILDKAMANVETSDLPDKAVSPLLKQLTRSRDGINAYKVRKAPLIARQKENDRVKQAVREEIESRVRVEQEFAKLVQDFNQLFKQRRYAEAEVLAKQAKELDPENPVAMTLFWKSRIARRNHLNEELKLDKEEGFWTQLHGAEEAAIGYSGREIEFPKNWKELTKRRKGRYGPSNRRRSEEEKRIEKSLSRQISLHFDKAPLQDVMKHVATVADVNVVLDNLGLEDEGVTTDTQISIDVDGIKLKSALNLVLKPLNLNYTIEDEVLKVTSKLRQQGQLVVDTYPVADLVVPVPNFTPAGSMGMSADGRGLTGFGGPQLTGGVQRPAGAQFQVNDPMNPMGGAGNPWNGQSNLQSSVSGGGSAIDFDTLSDLIITTVEPESWQEVGGPGSVRHYETTLSLVIRQTQKVHEEIRDLLAQLRRLQDLQVTIEVRLVAVADRFFERIGIDFDFDLQDNLGPENVAPGFGTLTGGFAQQGQQQQGQAQQGQAQQGQGQQGGQGAVGLGGIGGGVMARNMLSLSLPLQQVGQQQQGQQQQGQQQQGQQQQGGGAGGQFFDPPPNRAFQDQDDYQKGGQIIGLSNPGTFTADQDIAFRQGSFDIGVPDFGNFNPDAGIQFGMAILSDIEAFFFIQAAQGDERTNLMFAPKVTLFNGQLATIQDNVQRPFVTSLIPTVGFFSVGFTPQITVVNDGVTMQVQAVVSADRRYVRLSVSPVFQNITDVFTFSFVSGGGGLGGAGGLGGQQGGLGGGQIGQGGGQFGQFGQQGGFGGQGGQGGGLFGLGGIGGGTDARNMLSLSLPTQIGGLGGQQGGLGGQQGGLGGQQGGLGGQQGGLGGQGGQAAAGQNITIQQPVVEFINVSTVVSVPDGGTVLLGGVKRLREGRNMAGVPILNKLPYISRLFKNTGVGRETESLMMMVTPRIIIQEEEEELLGIEIEP